MRDVKYVEIRSLWLDISIILQASTIFYSRALVLARSNSPIMLTFLHVVMDAPTFKANLRTKLLQYYFPYDVLLMTGEIICEYQDLFNKDNGNSEKCDIDMTI